MTDSVAIICVYNDEFAYKEQLQKSLNNQNMEYELIGINNCNGKFKSAAAALNYGAKQASSDILIFSHQDIFIKGNDELKKYVEKIQKYPVGCILGAAGAKEKIKTNFGTYTSGVEYNPEYKMVEWNELEVSCIDECFFGMKKETFDMYPFNEQICDNWHLYGVERCLRARKEGYKVYVLPIQIHHFSHGRISIGYMRCLKKLVKQYNRDFKYIWTTCFKIPASLLFMNIFFTIWYCNRKLRRIGLE